MKSCLSANVIIVSLGIYSNKNSDFLGIGQAKSEIVAPFSVTARACALRSFRIFGGPRTFFPAAGCRGASAAGMAGVREREYSETQRKPIRNSLFLHFGLTRSKELITFAFRVTAKPAGSRQVAGPSQTANLTYDMQSFTPEVQKRFKYWQMRTLIATMIGYALFYFVLCKTFSPGRARVPNPPGLRRNEKTTVADRRYSASVSYPSRPAPHISRKTAMPTSAMAIMAM